MDSEAVTSVRNLLRLSAPSEARAAALEMLLEISRDDQGLELFTLDEYSVVDSVCSLCCAPCPQREKELALAILINISADSGSICLRVAQKHPSLLKFSIAEIIADSPLQLRCAQLLANLSLHGAEVLNPILTEHWGSYILDIFNRMADSCAEKEEADDYARHIGRKEQESRNLLLNLTILKSVRRSIVHEHLSTLTMLLSMRTPLHGRFSAICMLHNLSFDDELHPALLQAPYDLLAAVVAPLADKDADLDAEEMEKLPLQLQYYEKRRESSCSILLKCLETLYQFCATTHGRTVLRSKGIYALLRELDRATSGQVLAADEANFKDTLHSLIGVMIREEYEMGIPPELASIRDLAI